MQLFHFVCTNKHIYLLTTFTQQNIYKNLKIWCLETSFIKALTVLYSDYLTSRIKLFYLCKQTFIYYNQIKQKLKDVFVVFKI